MDPTVKQRDAKILRESLARVHKALKSMGRPDLTRMIETNLREYAAGVRPYCEHSDTTLVNKDLVCLDCGHKRAYQS